MRATPNGDHPAGIMEKIKIEGIKLSNELLHVKFQGNSNSKNTFSRLFRILAEKQINISFISSTYLSGRIHESCCVAIEDDGKVRSLIDSEPALTRNVKFIPSVGMISVFPHQSRPRILGLSLHALGKARVPVYGLASSISALTFVTDYGRLDVAASALKEYLELPPNQAPLRPQLRVKQSTITKEDRTSER